MLCVIKNGGITRYTADKRQMSLWTECVVGSLLQVQLPNQRLNEWLIDVLSRKYVYLLKVGLLQTQSKKICIACNLRKRPVREWVGKEMNGWKAGMQSACFQESIERKVVWATILIMETKSWIKVLQIEIVWGHWLREERIEMHCWRMVCTWGRNDLILFFRPLIVLNSFLLLHKSTEKWCNINSTTNRCSSLLDN